jgi:protein-disulfide isomerase
MNKALIFILAAITLLIVFVLGSSMFKGQEVKKAEVAVASIDPAVFVRDYAQVLGSDEAKVVIAEFFDPGCETCKAFHPFLKKVMAAYPGKIKLVMRYAPFHEGADTMVKILEATRKQDKYWEALDIMYGSQQIWAGHSNPQPDLIWQYLPQAGLDIDKLKADMNSPEIQRILDQDMADAKVLDVHQTPEFFVNQRPLVSFGYKQLLALIESELGKNYPELKR